MEPTVQQWQELYEAAAEFKKAACWKWLSNAHIFGVKNPEDGEIGYCCVMGGGGELYGLAVYLGSEGLETFVGMLTGELDEDPLFAQHCLMLSFDDRGDLYPQEYKQIKSLGLSFRGAKSWPTFRLYEPGFVPWPLQHQEHVKFLTVALRQTLEVAMEFKSDPDALIAGDEETFLTRVPSKTKNGLVWSGEWLQPEFIEDEEVITATPIDEFQLAKTKKRIKGTAGIWEIDCFFAPLPIDDGDRPYYPLLILIVDQGSGQILNSILSEKSQIADQVAVNFLKLIEQAGLLPSELWASNEKIFMYLSQILKVFDLQAYLTLELPALEEARDGMLSMLLER